MAPSFREHCLLGELLPAKSRESSRGSLPVVVTSFDYFEAQSLPYLATRYLTFKFVSTCLKLSSCQVCHRSRLPGLLGTSYPTTVLHLSCAKPQGTRKLDSQRLYNATLCSMAALNSEPHIYNPTLYLHNSIWAGTWNERVTPMDASLAHVTR